MINSKNILLIVKIWVLWSGLSVFTDPLFSAKGQKGRKWARNEHFWRNCSIPFMPFPWRGWVTCRGSDTASAPGAARLLRFQGELRAAAGNPRGGSVLFTHWECPRYCRGGLGGNIQAHSAHQRSHQGLPSFWRRVPAPPSISNYTCWSKRAKSHLAFELPKNTIFFNNYGGSFPPWAFDLPPAGSARRASGPL